MFEALVGTVYTRGTRARASAAVVVVCGGKAVEYSGDASLEQAEQTRRPRDVTHKRDIRSPLIPPPPDSPSVHSTDLDVPRSGI